MRVERTDSTTASWEAQRLYAQDHNRTLTQMRASRSDAEQIVDQDDVPPEAITSSPRPTETQLRVSPDPVTPEVVSKPSTDEAAEETVPADQSSTRPTSAQEVEDALRPPLFPPPWVRLMRDSDPAS